MKTVALVTVCALLGACIAAYAAEAPSPPASGTAAVQPPETLKERLSDKASDRQRVDDCKVPPAKRGTSRRPGCEARGHEASGHREK